MSEELWSLGVKGYKLNIKLRDFGPDKFKVPVLWNKGK